MICKEAWNKNILVKPGTWKETAWGSPAHIYLGWAALLPDSRKFSTQNQLTEFYLSLSQITGKYLVWTVWFWDGIIYITGCVKFIV